MLSDEEKGADDVSVDDLAADSGGELDSVAAAHGGDRLLAHIEKVGLLRGDAAETMPTYLARHPETVGSLLVVDLDLHDPTKVALETFLPRMPRDAVVAFDELEIPRWSSHTMAALNAPGIDRLGLRRLPWDPYASWASLG